MATDADNATKPASKAPAAEILPTAKADYSWSITAANWLLIAVGYVIQSNWLMAGTLSSFAGGLVGVLILAAVPVCIVYLCVRVKTSFRWRRSMTIAGWIALFLMLYPAIRDFAVERQPVSEKKPWEREWGPREQPTTQLDSRLPETLTLESRDKISGKAQITPDGKLVATFHNGNAEWTISELIINISEPDWFLRTLRAHEKGTPEPKLQKYRVALHLLPYASTEISIPVHWPVAEKYEWNIWQAIGTRQ